MLLQQAMMQLSESSGKNIKKLVMLSEYGLCIHKNGISGWVVSHFNSGKSILRHIKERKNVEGYIEKLIEILPDWTLTLKEWEQVSSDEKVIIKRKVDVLQQEILKEE